MKPVLSYNFWEAIKTGLRYANSAFLTEKKKYQKKQSNKTLLYTIIYNKIAREWFSILSTEEMKMVVEKRPRIFMKPFRPYISSRWKKRRTIKVICDSYDFLRENHLMHILDNENTLLSEFTLKDELKACLLWGYDEKLRKEGEFVLKFYCEQLGGVIAMASISFEKENEWICRIGCIQGNHLLPPDSMKQAQLQMHGLRPKVLMIFTIQSICKVFGITKIYGAGDEIIAHNKKHAIHIPWIHKLGFSYDDVWKEEGGQLDTEGWFVIPAAPKRKSIAEMKVHKRAYYRRRYELESDIAGQIEQSLNNLKRK